jgi:hypothetical protein
MSNGGTSVEMSRRPAIVMVTRQVGRASALPNWIVLGRCQVGVHIWTTVGSGSSFPIMRITPRWHVCVLDQSMIKSGSTVKVLV